MKHFYLFFIFLFPITCFAQTINGIVVNEKGQPVPYATVFIKEKVEGTVTNENGQFNLNLTNGDYHIVVRSLGYHQFNDIIKIDENIRNIKITLETFNYKLNEVKVFSGNEDPAYYIMRNAITKAPQHRQQVLKYEANLYLKSNILFTSIPLLIKKRVKVNDENLGDVIKKNKTYVIESVDKISYEFPNHYKQENISKKSSLTGFEEPPVMGLFTSSFYDERPENVISPLSALALNHYNFRYEGFINVGNYDAFKIKVIPKRKSDELVSGYIYIVDKLWSIYRIDFDISIKFVNFRLKQQYEVVKSDIWMPVSNTIKGKFSILGLKANFFYGSSIKYTSINANENIYIKERITDNNKPVKKKANAKIEYYKRKINDITAKENLSNRDVKKVARLNRKILKQQYKDSLIVQPKGSSYEIIESKDSTVRDEDYWQTIRTIPLTEEELKSYVRSDSIKAELNDTTKQSDKNKHQSVFNKILFGKKWYNRDSTTSIQYNGLVNAQYFKYNAVDGISYKQGAYLYFKIDSTKNIAIDSRVGYAFHRKAWLYSVEGRFNDIIEKGNYIELSTGKNSFDFKGDKKSINDWNNTFSTLIFAENYKKFYESNYQRLLISQKISKNSFVYGGANYRCIKELENHHNYMINDKKEYEPNIPINKEVEDRNLDNQKSFYYMLGGSYYHAQDKPWLESSAFLLINDYYKITGRIKHGLKNIFNSTSDFSLIDINYKKETNLTTTAGLVLDLNVGMFLHNDQMHFSDFKHFSSSESPVNFKSFTNNFQLLDDYVLSTNKYYVHISTEYRTEFLALRYLSFINQKAWSESLYLNHLSNDFTNYTEVGYSLNNLFFLGNIGVFAGFKKEEYNSIGIKVSIAID